jgi:hypothetical protein
LVALLTGTALAGCSPQSGGPRVWVDQPLDGRSFPLGPVTLLAHAVDVDGLRSIEFRIDDAPVGEVSVDAERFGEAGFEWLPPGPGTYSLEVVAVNAAGGRGTSARVTIIIADAGLLSYGTPTPAPANVPSIVITGITCGPQYTVKVDFEVSSPGGVISVEIYSAYTAAGRNERTYTAPYPLTVKDTLWVDEEDPDFLDRPHQVVVVAKLVGQPNEVSASPYEPGPKQRCPGHFEGDQQLAATLSTQALWIARLNTNCRTGPGTAFDSLNVIESGAQAPIDGKNAEGTWFRVLPPGSSRTCWVSIASGEVQGELAGVPVINVAPPATATPTPAPANQPPVIQDFTASPGLILTDGTGCPAYSRTVTLSAVVSDDAGIDSVVAQWSLGSLSGETTLQAAGGGSYSGAIGPVTQVGTMSIDLIVRDTSGVAAQSGPRTVNVQNCIE